MKIIKFLVKFVICILAILLIAVLALPLWFGPVVKSVANVAVPKVVETEFNLRHLALNPYTSRFELGDLQLWNPVGYPEKFAVTVGDIIFDAETLSLATDVIHIEEIKVKDVFVSYVKGGKYNVDNFTQIQYNIAGGKEKYEATQAAKAEQEQLEELQAKEDAQAKRENEPSEDAKSKRVIIDRLEISGFVFQWGIFPIRVPSLTLVDIGRQSGGATVKDALTQIWTSILKSAGVAFDQLQALGGFIGDSAAQAGKLAGDAAAQAGKAAKQATESATKAMSGVTDAAGKATESATKAVSGVTDAAGKAAGDATKAVGDSAKKALDAINSLW